MAKPKIHRAIYFYTEDGENLVMNYSSLSDRDKRKDGRLSVYEFLRSQNGSTVEMVDRGSGHKRHGAVLVINRAKLETEAARHDVTIVR